MLQLGDIPLHTPMTAYLLTNHVLNFIAPAAAVALLLLLLSRFSSLFSASKKPLRQTVIKQVAIIFAVNVVILAAGLAFFGNDGKMATYAAMVLVSALCQWLLLRGWRD